jgi:hypothetical protein
MQQYLAYALLGGGALWLLIQWGVKLIPLKSARVTPSGKAVRSSDQTAPLGFKEHMLIIQEACPSANAEVRWGYALEGLTEALVLRREVERLGKGAT